MAQKLEVKVVSEKEWRSLLASGRGCEHVDEESMGFAKAEEGKAYVRQTFWPELNKYLIQHEFEHLLEDKGTDECVHGVRHKKFFKQILAPALPYLAAVVAPQFLGATGPLASALTSASAAAATKGITGLATGQSAIGKSALQAGGIAGAGSLLTSGLGSLLKGTTPATQTTRPLVGGGSQALQTSLPGLGGDVVPRLGQGLGGVGSSTNLPSLQASFQSAQQQVDKPFAFPGATPPPPGKMGIGQILGNLFGGGTGQQTGQGTQSGLDRFGISSKLLGPAALGAGIAGIGQLAGPKRPEVPEFGQLAGVQRFGQESQNRLGSLAGRFQNLPNAQIPDTLLSPIRRQYELQRRQFTSQFKAFRPGADLATDTEYARGINDLNQREAEAVSQTQLGFQGEQRQNLLAELGVTEDQASLLGQLAQLDIDTISARTKLSADEAAQFKDIFGNLGIAVASQGFA